MIKFNLASIAIFGRMLLLIAWTATALHAAVPSAPVPKRTLTRSYALPHWLVIHGEQIPAREIRINVLEAYCRAGSTDADLDQHTVIPHRAELISLNDDRTRLRLRDTYASEYLGFSRLRYVEPWKMHAAYLPLESPRNLESVRERVLETVSRSRPDSGGTTASDVRRHAASANAVTTPTGPSDRAVAFYYPWYGDPSTDGHYSNWNHAVAVRNEPP